MSSSDNLFLNVWFNDDSDEAYDQNIIDANQQVRNNLPSNTSKKPHSSNNKRNNDGRPRRPLSAYNIFFQIERERIMKSQKFVPVVGKKMKNAKRIGKHANVGFANLARMVSDRWKSIDVEFKLKLEAQSREDKERYKREMEVWQRERSRRETPLNACNSDSSRGDDCERDCVDRVVPIVSPESSPKKLVPILQMSRDCLQSLPPLPFGSSSDDFCAPCEPGRDFPITEYRQISSRDDKSSLQSRTSPHFNDIMVENKSWECQRIEPEYSPNHRIYNHASYYNTPLVNPVSEFVGVMTPFMGDTCVPCTSGVNGAKEKQKPSFMEQYDVKTDEYGLDLQREEVDDMLQGMYMYLIDC